MVKIRLNKMNRMGIFRIIEASIAILIIFGVILTILIARKPSVEESLSDRIGPLLEEIAKNNSMREDIIKGQESEANITIMNFLSTKIEPNIGYGVRICKPDETCGLSYPEGAKGNIYVGSRVISSVLTDAKPKRLSIFLWVKG